MHGVVALCSSSVSMLCELHFHSVSRMDRSITDETRAATFDVNFHPCRQGE